MNPKYCLVFCFIISAAAVGSIDLAQLGQDCRTELNLTEDDLANATLSSNATSAYDLCLFTGLNITIDKNGNIDGKSMAGALESVVSCELSLVIAKYCNLQRVKSGATTPIKQLINSAVCAIESSLQLEISLSIPFGVRDLTPQARCFEPQGITFYLLNLLGSLTGL